MQRRGRHHVSVLWLLSFGACVDIGVGPTEQVIRGSAAAVERREDNARRFDVHVSAARSEANGIDITMVVDVNLSASMAKLRITLPEVMAASQSNPDGPLRIVAGEVIEPSAEVSTPVAAGTRRTITTRLSITRSGYYRVDGAAFTISDEPAMYNGVFVQSEAHDEVWLLVHPDGRLTVTKNFEPWLLPDSIIRQPGPIVSRRSRPQSEYVSSNSREASSAMTSSDYWRAYGYVSDASGASYEPLPRYTVNYRYMAVDDWGTTYLRSQYYFEADTTGMFSLPCPDYESDWYELGAQLRNSSVYIDGSSHTDVGYTSHAGWDCGISSPGNPIPIIAAQTSQVRVFNNMTRSVIDAARIFPGVTRSQLKVKVLSNTGVSAFSWPGDYVEIYSDDVWGPWGIFVTAHEFNHALSRRYTGRDLGSCGGPHYLHLPSSASCAYDEGFANAFAGLTEGHRHSDYFLSASGFESATGRGAGGYDVEGAVAAYLYDLIDDSSTSDGIPGDDDTAAYGGKYVYDVIKNCQVTWVEPTPGSDGNLQIVTMYPGSAYEVHNCFRRAADSTRYITVLDTFNQPVALYASSVQGLPSQPAGFSAAEVDRLYRWNILGQQ